MWDYQLRLFNDNFSMVDSATFCRFTIDQSLCL
jgi:hypothetical protein